MLSPNTSSPQPARPAHQLGLFPNLGQFILLASITGGVGLVVGAERIVVPVLAKQDFGVASFSGHASLHRQFWLCESRAQPYCGPPGRPLRAQAAARPGLGYRIACAISDHLRAVLGMDCGSKRAPGYESGTGLDDDRDEQD